MPRTLTPAQLDALFARETDEALLVFMEVSHPEMAAPLRLVRNTENVEVGGVTYAAAGFDVILPDSDSEQLPSAQVIIDNVDRVILEQLRAFATPLDVRLWLALSSDPATPLAGPYEFRLRNVEYDAERISGELRFDDLADVAFPGARFVPSLFPGLFTTS